MATTQFFFLNRTSQNIYLLERLDKKQTLLKRKLSEKAPFIRTAKNKICKEGFIRQKTFLEKRDIKSIFQEDKTKQTLYVTED